MANANIIVPIILICTFSFLHNLFLNKQHKRKQKQNVLKSNVEEEGDIFSSGIELHEEIFRNIASEIHDNICLTLSLAKLYLDNPAGNTYPELHDQVNMSGALIRKAMTDLSRLSKALNPDVVEKFGLVRSVEVLVSDMQQSAHLDISFVVNGITRDLDARDELQIYRVVQESFNNIIKHARANIVEVVFDYYTSHLNITITDNGAGFDTHTISIGAGIGNMKRRVKMLNGIFAIESKQAGGTTIKISIPLNTH